MDKKKNVIYKICLVVIISVSAVNVYIALGDKNETDIALVNIIALADESGSYSCSSGGPGSTSCSTSSGIGNLGTSCQVSCSSGYYACCNAYENKCQCRPN
jgi:hypothetical protein